MNENVIDISNLSMRFNLASEKTDGLKEYVIMRLKGKLVYNDFYALKNIDFKVKRGESYGIIGSNGSGKSTLLKCISGIYTPSVGEVSVSGTIAPLIELGAGFDPDLTGRENIFLNGAVMGFQKKFMEEKYSEIVEFSELHNFMDVPIKNYSSGMIARLGFSTATLVKPEILIVDEILSVGDYSFQQKCNKKMEELMSGGTTLLFVSHSPELMKTLCSKAIWLLKGEKIADGPSEDVFIDYMKWASEHTSFE